MIIQNEETMKTTKISIGNYQTEVNGELYSLRLREDRKNWIACVIDEDSHWNGVIASAGTKKALVLGLNNISFCKTYRS